ncbi:hypothetical protein NUU61_000174 [Penicillium alfredii]|uniref:Uncharacterized protein n=1 Tax=Penicillium alfredii TaxID=1506179 RepID=A0A9W9G927_9EURO|nr:uncharacterized protein NUU61_000174 [Penicillium alfredii]KAJ5114415.1 hypothetical protein NUU61_000174 [Penicillium alfredii]
MMPEEGPSLMDRKFLMDSSSDNAAKDHETDTSYSPNLCGLATPNQKDIASSTEL